MKSKLLLISLLAAGLVASQAQAEEVDYFTASGVINLSTGVPVPVGDTVWLGYFPTNDPSFFTNNQTFSSLMANFTFLSSIQFGQDASGVPGGGSIVPSPAGTYYGVLFPTVPLPPPSNATGQLFIWMFNANNPSSATEWAILTNVGWTRPPTGPNQILIDPTLNGTVPTGALGLLTPNGSGGFDINLQVIPEPSVIFLGVAGGVALLGFHRRRQRLAA